MGGDYLFFYGIIFPPWCMYASFRVTLTPLTDAYVSMGREDDARINKGSFPPKDGPLNHEVYCFELGSPGILSVTP
jgi:hypothetical protein